MSFLFHKRTKAIAKGVWYVVAIMVILGMVSVFGPGLALLQ